MPDMGDDMTASAKTFDLDKTLPPLPVPKLADTCARYLASVEPLVNKEDLARISGLLDELQASGGVGERLQQALEARGAAMDNWLLAWWADAAYLAWPDSLVCNSSIGISADAAVAPGDQVSRATQVVWQTLEFYLSIINETMPPDLQRDGSALDMSLLRNFFSTSRMPGSAGDRLVTYGPEDSRHIIVIRRSHLFRIDVIDATGRLISPGDLFVQLERVIAEADRAPLTPPVAVLTAARRPDWAVARERLAADATNRASLDQIDRAIFMVGLDAESHASYDELARAGLHGAAGSRWHDKSLHMVIDADGRVTLHGEHTPIDAGAWVPLLEKVSPPGEPIVRNEACSLPAPHRLVWDFSVENFRDIDLAQHHLDGLTSNLDLHIRQFDQFGKNEIKTLKTGPDPFVQMSYQLAYWRMHGRSPKVYEAASTRMYRGGRTETIRSTTNQSRAFVMAMDDAGVSPDAKVALMREAFAEHSQRAKDASAGYGVDRHMLGLQLIASELGVTELPAIFNEPVHKRGWELSTAQLPMRHAFVNHFAPVCPQGYGIGYVIKDDHVNLQITAWEDHPETSAVRFADAICQAMMDMRQLVKSVDEQAAA